MILIIGPMFSGKRETAMQLLHCGEAELAEHCVCDVQELAAFREDIEALADELAVYEVLTAAEIGCGVVPLDPAQRAARERAGRLACLLAERADTVVRVFCGIPKVIKGELK